MSKVNILLYPAEGLKRVWRRAALLAVLAVAVMLPAWGQEVNGIYTEPATKDLGAQLKIDWLKNVKLRGWVESGYFYNRNKVSRALANANQSSSAIRSRDYTIEGHAFHSTSNSFDLALAEAEIEKVPERGGVGFKVDLAAGDVQDTIVDSIKAVSPTGVSEFDKTFQHASISYVAPVGSGLRFDFGKFVTHIGGETIESIKNRNFTHSFFYSYAIPFQDSGLRVNYAVNSKVYTEFYLLNGWNVTSDNNSAKTYGASVGLTPSSKFNLYANYLGGPERNDNDDDWRHLFDLQAIVFPVPSFQMMLNIDVGKDKNAIGLGKDALWRGATLYLRPSVKGRFFPTGRIEYYEDRDGFSTGVPQHLWGFTFTPDLRLTSGDDGFAKVMLRPEIRYDKSTAPFFSDRDKFRTKDNQLIFGAGLVAYF